MRSPGWFILLLLQPLATSCAPLTTDDALSFLESFYITPPSLRTDDDGDSRDPTTVRREAIKQFQEGAGIAVTGDLDDTTRAKMAEPRCGVPEFASLRVGGDAVWPKSEITYTLHNSDSGMEEAVTRNAIQKAFAVYSAVTPLKFKEVKAGGDMEIRFGRRSHDCNSRFDGPSRSGGTILAHASYPEDGDVHFDADEKWTVMSANHLPVSTHVDFLTVAIHEIGHALGLSHEYNNPSSILAPSYNKPIDQWGMYVPPALDAALIAKIQRFYGKAAPAAAPAPTSYIVTPPSGKYCLWAKNNRYLRAHEPGGKSAIDFAPHCRALEHWTAEVVDGKVAFKNHFGYLRAVPDGTVQIVAWRYDQELWTPYGNSDDKTSWSFKSAHGTWLSSHLGNSPSLQPHNKMLERWWTVPVK